MDVTSLGSLNCANCPTNCEGSTGLVGSWCCSCATSSCKNMLFKLCPLGNPFVGVVVVPPVGGVGRIGVVLMLVFSFKQECSDCCARRRIQLRADVRTNHPPRPRVPSNLRLRAWGQKNAAGTRRRRRHYSKRQIPA